MQVKKWLVLLCLFFTTPCGTPPPTYAKSTIIWEIGNRYRAFDYINKEGTPSPRASADLLETFKPGVKESAEQWFERVSTMESPFARTSGPWIEKDGTYQKDFVDLPKELVLKATLEANGVGSEQLAGQDCSWRVGEKEIDRKPCGEPIDIDDFDSNGGKVSVYQGEVEIASTEIRPRLSIVLGLGDSYASGEGSPDVPTVWKKDIDRQSWPPKGEENVKDYVRSGASWWSNRCDRSFYSYQNMVALYRSMEEKHSVVAFVHLACSGAEIVDGLLAPQRLPPGHQVAVCKPPKDRPDPDAFDPRCDVPHSQLYTAVKLLCRVSPEPMNPQQVDTIRKPLHGLRHGSTQWKWLKAEEFVSCPESSWRNIDQVLLSIGGNDIGFSGIIATVLMPERTRLINIPIIGNIAKLIVDFGQEKAGAVCTYTRADKKCPNSSTVAADIRIKELPKRFLSLGRAMPIILRVKPEQILLNQYPNPLRDKQNIRDKNYKRCGDPEGLAKDNAWLSTKLIMEIPDNWQVNLRKDEAKDVELHDITELNDTLKKESGKLKWKTAPLQSVMLGHGWCTGDNVKLLPLDKLDTWRPYAPNTRFIRTANDSFLTQWPSEERENGFNGTFHPNAQGYAAIASGVLRAIKGETQTP